jgi:hypothetical protein
MMDLQSIGDDERKRACAQEMIRKVITLRSFSYSPFWEEVHKNWAAVFAREYTLAEAIEELLATIEDLLAAVERGDCTPAGLHIVTECYNDLVDAYDLDGPNDLWDGDLYDLVTRLDTITLSPEQAAAIASQQIPRLRERLADERRRSE